MNPAQPLPSGSRQSQEALACLRPSAAVLTRQMLDAWSEHRLGSLRHEHRSVSLGIYIVSDFIRHSGKPPWDWTEKAFDGWCYDLGVRRRVAQSTQRQYQHAIRQFLAYLCGNIALQNQVRHVFSRQVQQICSSANMLPHLVDRELATERAAISREHIDHFFAELDEQIRIAHRFGSKALHPLQRDKVLFAIMYYGGLRADEALRLNVSSFHENPQNPSMGKYASIMVWGKGANGSGKKPREVWFTTLTVPPLAQFYLDHVRPQFLKPDNANESALFLSQRGTRLGYAALHRSFTSVIRACGLHGMGYCPHSLRHSSVTHEASRFSLFYNRDKHGHVYASTTEHYYHGGNEANGDELNRALQAQIDAASRTAPPPLPGEPPSPSSRPSVNPGDESSCRTDNWSAPHGQSEPPETN
ncbi:tyrosine-type recombinase/integrase [Burkholderia ubonensis]|uniref:tyrosine-type recombinase/integrase n=1 Tax=Burkholderia ubonensis TaxID=101571 RepID=UPI0012F87B4C|nr:site-specific integrase [Burkholderia ubonensis]